jgi:hypothetical protein
MTENETRNNDKAETSKKKEKRTRKTARKTQAQLIQESLGMKQEDIADVEDKLFIVRFLDYFSEETLDFSFKDKMYDKYLEKLVMKIKQMAEGNEEDKLVEQHFREKDIIQTANKVKERVEERAKERGFKTSADRKLRRLSLMITIPMLAIVVIFTIFPVIDPLFLFPILCVFCLVPQFLRGFVLRKWFRFKDENRKEIYLENRDDLMVLKSFVGEVLNNIRAKLLEEGVPLQLIKFALHSQDYENLELINQKAFRGLNQYYYMFRYPEGMEPFTVPENLKQFDQPLTKEAQIQEKPEKNFIVLTELKAKEGIIERFIPTLKDNMANQINQMLNDSEFSPAPIDFRKIVPNYGEGMAIYCVCGETAEIINVQLCKWKGQFEYYLFEGMQCNCNEKVYALSLLDDSDEIPEELRPIFSS